jgi:hypothetical protein
MGYNTSILICNDQLHLIREDVEFGKKLYDAICQLSRGAQVEIPGHGATAVETHHANGYSFVAFGANKAIPFGPLYPYGDEDFNISLLRTLADNMGYHLRKKPTTGPHNAATHHPKKR